jgi:CubicO group peptidase (beta-lactamase class C family)
MIIIISLLLAFAIIRYLWISLPIISGFNAKQMCTCFSVSGRNKKDIETSDLGKFPLNIATNKIDEEDASVTTTIFGFAKQKAIYREGLGCTIVKDINEADLRTQVTVIPAAPALDRNNIPWPDGDKVNPDLPSAINKIKLDNAITMAFMEPRPHKKQRTRAVVIVYDGQLVAEKYAPGFDQNMKMYGWSIAKSFTAALIGILVKQGKLNLMEPAPVPEWSNPNDLRHAITIQNLLQQSSGLSFKEIYTRSSDVTKMLFRNGDMGAYAASRKLVHKPGTVFNYSGGNSNILSRIIRQTVGEKDYSGFPYKELFYKTGMYNTLFEPDASGTYVGSSYINATARDYARFGLLYYNNGIWNGEQILPENWVQQTASPAPSNSLKTYGYQFWLNGFDKEHPSKRKYADVPADMFYCDGFGFEMIYIIPSKKLVVVRLGLTLDKSFDENSFLKNIIDSIDF